MTIQKQVLELFKQLQAQYGFACLFISHDLGGRRADRRPVVVMRAGRIVEEGSATTSSTGRSRPTRGALLDAATTSDLLRELALRDNARDPVEQSIGE